MRLSLRQRDYAPFIALAITLLLPLSCMEEAPTEVAPPAELTIRVRRVPVDPISPAEIMEIHIENDSGFAVSRAFSVPPGEVTLPVPRGEVDAYLAVKAPRGSSSYDRIVLGPDGSQAGPFWVGTGETTIDVSVGEATVELPLLEEERLDNPVRVWFELDRGSGGTYGNQYVAWTSGSPIQITIPNIVAGLYKIYDLSYPGIQFGSICTPDLLSVSPGETVIIPPPPARHSIEAILILPWKPTGWDHVLWTTATDTLATLPLEWDGTTARFSFDARCGDRYVFRPPHPPGTRGHQIYYSMEPEDVGITKVEWAFAGIEMNITTSNTENSFHVGSDTDQFGFDQVGPGKNRYLADDGSYERIYYEPSVLGMMPPPQRWNNPETGDEYISLDPGTTAHLDWNIEDGGKIVGTLNRPLGSSENILISSDFGVDSWPHALGPGGKTFSLDNVPLGRVYVGRGMRYLNTFWHPGVYSRFLREAVEVQPSSEVVVQL